MRRSVAFRASCAHHADSTRGERDMRVASVHLRHMLAASIAVTLVSVAPVCAVGVSNVVDAVRRNGEYVSAVASHDVMSAYESVDEPGRLYLTSDAASATDTDMNADEGATSSQRVPQERVELPWDITATFTLDGPTVSASKISGASGVVGIRIDLKSERPEETADLTPIVAFTIPNRVGNDATSDEGVLVSAGNSSTLVAAVGKPGEDLTIHTYVTAKNFTMSSSRSSNNCAIMKRSLPKRPSPSVSRNMSRRSTGISTRTSARIRRIFPDRLAIPRNLPPFSAPRPN